METADIEWVLERKHPRVFPYFKDRYALLLLAWAADEGESVRALKQGRFSALFDKPVVKDVAARAPQLTRDLLLGVSAPSVEHYRITLGRWGARRVGEWRPAAFQTTRPGENLVLQLNFPRSHHRPCFGLVAPYPRDRLWDEHPWICAGHPVARHELTLAWARIDVAFDSSEALIEEIQSDWVRNALAEARELASLRPEELSHAELFGFPSHVGVYHVLSYVEHVLAPHTRMWAEATLAAALWYLREVLQIRRVFYNTYETGTYLKDLDDQTYRPPRSLYTDLPRRFCFRRTSERPAALSRCRHPLVRKKLQRTDLEWFLLEL
ncbi:MAG: hypothetical protein H6717_32260 [Polyangiaceae bacterium]|nr:hypothetical protein [Polyangiaceae bacterium]